MFSSIVHHPCEISLHLVSQDIFIHPPPPNTEIPGDDKTLRGLVEIKCPSERHIQGVKVVLQGVQTLAIPENASSSASSIRWEEKVIMEKTVEIMNDGIAGAIPVRPSRSKGKVPNINSPGHRDRHDWVESDNSNFESDSEFESTDEFGEPSERRTEATIRGLVEALRGQKRRRSLVQKAKIGAPRHSNTLCSQAIHVAKRYSHPLCARMARELHCGIQHDRCAM